jgi:hypothetical protein
MYNTVWHEGLNENAAAAIFLLLRSVCHGDMKK